MSIIMANKNNLITSNTREYYDKGSDSLIFDLRFDD